jgi:glutamine synthetase
MYKPGKEQATRIELRSPDPAANPYLCFAATLGAGLEGIEKGYELPAAVEENIFSMETEDLTAKGIDSLPGSLFEAVELLKNSELMKNILGEHMHSNFVNNKRIEWDEYRTHISEFELRKYLPIL